MIKHLEKFVLPQGIQYSKRIEQWSKTINSMLSGQADNTLNIIGTSHPYEGVQLYGWQSPIADHKDETGFILFMPISMSGDDELVSEGETIPLQAGHLYLLDDRKLHSTLGNASVIALFKGSFTQKRLNDVLYAEVLQEFSDYLQE